MEYVARFDVEYGTLIRRYIQYRAKLPGIEGEVVGDVLHAHPRVALLYWMEKFLYQETPFHEGDDMCEVVEEFGIHSVSSDDAAAFALVLLEYDIYLGVEYLCMLPKLFEHTQVLLFLATELPSHGREIEKNITRLIRDCTGVNITRRMLECVRTARDDDVLMPLSQRRQALMAHAWYAS